MKKVIAWFLRKVRSSPPKLSFIPRREQIKGWETLPDRILDRARIDIAVLDIRSFLMCGGHFTAKEWLELSIEEVELVKKVMDDVANSEVQFRLALAGKDGILVEAKEREEGRIDTKWARVVMQELSNGDIYTRN